MPKDNLNQDEREARRRAGIWTNDEEEQARRRAGIMTQEELDRARRRAGIVTSADVTHHLLSGGAAGELDTPDGDPDNFQSSLEQKLPAALRWRWTGVILGKGGQAEVLEVVDKKNPEGTKFALKTLKPSKPHNALTRFKAEIEAIKSITHPNIIQVIDARTVKPFHIM